MLRQCTRTIRHHRKALALSGGVILLLIATLVFWPMNEAHYLVSESSCVLLDRAGQPLHFYLNSNRQWCREVELDDISPSLIQAVIAAEDQRFWNHPGVDPLATMRAGWQFVRDHRIRSGASTLTMQLAKLAGNPSHSLLGKLRQNFLAIRLDVHAQKRDILRAYLNRASYGANLIGCEMAARYYFGKAARELNLSEAALIAALPNAPLHLNPLRRPAQALRRRNYILGRMCEEGLITIADRNRACAAPLGIAIHTFPNHASHLASSLSPIARGRVQLFTTLDAPIQSMAEDLVMRQLKSQATVKRGGLVVLDAASAEVLAWVGEVKDATGGVASDIRATSDPSLSVLTLEQFVNSIESQDFKERKAAAPDLGQLLDSPRFQAEGAPVATMIRQPGHGSIMELLNPTSVITQSWAKLQQGDTPLNTSAGIRLDELAAAYCMLVNHGQWRPLAVLPGAKTAPRQLLSSETAQHLCAALGSLRPGELAAGLAPKSAEPASRICWKTGLFQGGHGDWAFVFNEQYVVGAWILSEDGLAARERGGGSLPLLWGGQMLGRLGSGPGAIRSGRKDSRTPVEVCTLSGLPRTIYCPHSRRADINWGDGINRVCCDHWPVKSLPQTPLNGQRTMVSLSGNVLAADSRKGFESWFGRNFSQGSPGSKLIALSFDDGPSPQWTPQIVQILKNEAVPADFFMLGECVQKHPEIARAVAASGFEIGCHSFSHPNLTQLNTAAVRREVLDSKAIIQRVIGRAPFLFRPPGGESSLAVNQMCAADKMVIIKWSVDPRDWEPSSTAEAICSTTVQSIHGGAIILLHDIHRKTVLALPGIIRRLKALGYQFTTVSRLIAQKEEDRRMPPLPAVAVLGGDGLMPSEIGRLRPEQHGTDGHNKG